MEDFKFKKSLGQNFLIDNNIVEKIVNLSEIVNDSLIVEIGPGAGALTKELIKHSSNVLCFEIDMRLKEQLDKIQANNLKIVYEDFLKADINSYIKDYQYTKLYVIANIPYYITTPIIEKVINETNADSLVLMVQKEVGNRFQAKPSSKEYNSLSVYLQYYFDIKKIVDVSKNCFVPKPNVDSIVVKFTRKERATKPNDEAFFFKFVRDSFKQKRKNIKNNLKDYNLEKVEKALKTIGRDLTVRAEALSVEDFIKITNELN